MLHAPHQPITLLHTRSHSFGIPLTLRCMPLTLSRQIQDMKTEHRAARIKSAGGNHKDFGEGGGRGFGV